MIKSVHIYSILVLSILSGIVLASEDNTVHKNAEKLRDTALKSTQAWDILESLTTEVGARLAGTESDKRAVAWAEKLLDRSGLDRVWLEKVEFPIWQRHKEHARVVAPFPQSLHITALGYSGSTNGELRARLISFESLEKLKAASPRTVKGKIVLINQRMKRTRDGHGYGDISAMRREGGKVAKEKGAVALLIRSLGTDKHRFPHTGASYREKNPLAAAALSAPDADQLERILARGKPVTMALTIDVSLTEGGESYNVIGQIDGREKPDEVVLIGAHLDSWDLSTGALDDGAGVALTTTTIQMIAALEQRPKRSIRVVLFANEEQGLWGAKAYAAKHAEDLANHIVASESDFGAGRIWSFDTASSRLMEAAMPLLEDLGIEKGKAATGGGPDIIPMAKKGVPVFRLNQDGTDYFDYHHTADDTLDKVDAEALKQNLAAWAVVTYLAAELGL